MVPPISFDPPPKVGSSVIYIQKDMDKELDFDFNKFLKVCVSHPREKLSENLSTAYNKARINSIFDELNIKECARPHEVDASLYSHIYTKVKHNGGDESFTHT